jgi:hypothetical protein
MDTVTATAKAAPSWRAEFQTAPTIPAYSGGVVWKNAILNKVIRFADRAS